MMMFGRFSDAQPVTKSDSNTLPAGTTGLYIGTGGNLVVDLLLADGTVRADVPFKNIPNGALLWDGPFYRVKAASTTADVVAMIGR